MSFIHKLSQLRKLTQWRWVYDRSPAPELILWQTIVSHSRQVEFYRDCGVPDSLDGRFNLICLHLYLVLRRLKNESHFKQPAKHLAQRLFDLAFKDLDRSLRQLGVGDLSVGRKVKEMAKALYGKINAFEVASLTNTNKDQKDQLENAVARNIFNADTVTPQARLIADYLRSGNHLADSVVSSELINHGVFIFPKSLNFNPKTHD